MLYNRKQAHVSMARLARVQANTHGHQPYAYATPAPAATEMVVVQGTYVEPPAEVVVQGTYVEPPADRPGVLPGTYLRS